MLHVNLKSSLSRPGVFVAEMARCEPSSLMCNPEHLRRLYSIARTSSEACTISFEAEQPAPSTFSLFQELGRPLLSLLSLIRVPTQQPMLMSLSAQYVLPFVSCATLMSGSWQGSSHMQNAVQGPACLCTASLSKTQVLHCAIA